MSTGTRIPLPRALDAARQLCELWGMRAPECMIVGGIRRRRQDVGDIDLVAPLPPALWSGTETEAHEDALYDSIAATVELRPRDRSLLEPEPVPGPKIIGREVKGLTRGFRCAELSIDVPGMGAVAVQVSRYTRRNRGWIELMRTGPGELGRWFLARWKVHHQIPASREASVKGHLVDGRGNIIVVEDERDCFKYCGLEWVAPEDRDEWMRRALQRSSR